MFTLLFIAVATWRIFLFVLAYIAATAFIYSPQFPYSDVYLIPSKLPQWVWSWANFDGVHYLTIAKMGYAAQFTQAFFPIYPLLLRFIASILPNSSLIVLGITLSFMSFVFAIHFLYKLLRLDYPKNQVLKSIGILLCFPTSFYFAAVYTESLFFLLVVFALWFSRNKKWWFSGLLAALASGTRLTGIFLFPALLWEWWLANKKKDSIQSFSLLPTVKIILKSPILYTAPLGLFLYMLYLHVKFGDWLYFWHAQSAFGAQRISEGIILPLQVIWRYFKIITTVSYTQQNFHVAVTELISFCFAVVLLIVSHQKKVRMSYLIFSWFVILIPSLTGTLSSLPRYILLAFPIVIILGGIKSKYIYTVIIICSIIFLTFLSIEFLRGLWVA